MRKLRDMLPCARFSAILGVYASACFAATLALAASTAARPTLRAPERTLSGAIRVEIEASEEVEASEPNFEIVETRVRNGRTTRRRLYLGPGPEAYLSGLPEGAHRLQVRVVDPGRSSQWSAPVVVSVAAPHRALLWSSLLLGSLVFLATTLVIVVGARAEERGAPKP